MVLESSISYHINRLAMYNIYCLHRNSILPIKSLNANDKIWKIQVVLPLLGANGGNRALTIDSLMEKQLPF